MVDSDGSVTQVSRLVRAPRTQTYRALVDAKLLAQWLAPSNMRGVVHAYDPRPGGRLRMSLTYKDPASGGGKTTEDTDTFEGTVVELVPDERVVWDIDFESDQPGMSGTMRVIWDLADAPEGTEVTSTCKDIPPGIPAKDNEAGSASSLRNLARLLEG